MYICSHIYILFLTLSPIMLYHKWLDIVPCAVEQDLIAYSLQMQKFASTNPKLPDHIPPSPSFLATTSLFFMSMNLFCFCGEVHLFHMLISRYKWYNMVSVCLTSLNMRVSNSIHVVQMTLYCSFFVAESYSIVYMHQNFLIHSSVDVHLGFFCILTIVNSVAMNLGMHISFSVWIYAQEWDCCVIW